MALIVGGVDTTVLADELKTFLADSMPTSLDGVTQDLDDWIDDNEERLEDWLDNLIDRLDDWVDSVSDQLSDADADLLDDWLDGVEDDLEDYLENGLEALDDLIDGTEKADEIRAGDGCDEVSAQAGTDMVYGEGGDDNLDGGSGDDKIAGGAGDDILLGGLGKDILKGGADADSFVFELLKHSAAGSMRDVVYFDDSDDDEIDLTGIDACESDSGNQAFDWIGQKAFSGEEGELRLKGGILGADVDGDGRADFTLKIEGTLWVDDILL